MFHYLLENPWVYNLTQWFWYRPGEQQRYIQDWIRPRSGDCLLDIGCGPGSLLGLMEDVHYVGYDPNPSYINQAIKRFGKKGDFRCGYLTKIQEKDYERFDVVMLNGVLHHMSDEQVLNVLSLAQKALKPGGRIVTRDGCYEERQNWLAHFLLTSDRGAFVRTQQAYAAVIGASFVILRSEILRNALRLPYSLIHFEAIKSKS